MKTITKEFAQKINKFGILDTHNYRYVLKEDDEHNVYYKRIAIDALGTTATLSDKSDYNPHGWEIVIVK